MSTIEPKMAIILYSKMSIGFSFQRPWISLLEVIWDESTTYLCMLHGSKLCLYIIIPSLQIYVSWGVLELLKFLLKLLCDLVVRIVLSWCVFEMYFMVFLWPTITLDLKMLESKFSFKVKHGCGFCCITRGALTICHVDLTEEYIDNKAHVMKRSSLQKRRLNPRLSCTFETIIYKRKCIECPTSICLNIQIGVFISLNCPLQDFFHRLCLLHQLIESWIPYTKLEFLLGSKLSWMLLLNLRICTLSASWSHLCMENCNPGLLNPCVLQNSATQVRALPTCLMYFTDSCIRDSCFNLVFK